MEKFTMQLSLLLLSDEISQSSNSLLEENFHTNLYAKTINKANGFFEKLHIDIVLVDLDTDKNEKLQFVKELQLQNPFLIFFFLSTEINEEILLESISLGVSGYLKKPFNQEEFLKKVNLLEKKIEVFNEYRENQQNYKLLKQYQDITDQSSIISKTDKQGRITFANDNFCEISGYSKDELIGRSHNIVRHPESKNELFREMWDTIQNQKIPWSGILKNRAKDGSSYYVKTTVTPVLDKNGEILEFIALRHNISSILSDKQHFLDTINSNWLSLLVLVQINGFDMLEKFYNLTTIDNIEKMFGFKLVEYFPQEFAFRNVFQLDNGRYALVASLEEFMENEVVLKQYLGEFENNVKKSPLDIDGIEYDISVTLSYTMGKHMLYEDAKAGLEEAIEKNISLFNANDYSIKHQLEAKKNLEVIKMVKTALENYKIVSYFQPIINNSTGTIEKYESLVRLVDENDKIISPYEFLNISKKGAYYNRITQRVLDNSFEILHSIKTELSINLSTLDIEKDETKDYIYRLLESYKGDVHRLVFELLEDENAKDFNSIKEFIQTVKSFGVKIAIDDFGAGYSNFERLLDFDPDIIKIDGSLIKNITTNEYNKSVVETIVTFAKKQNIMVIAEFVETKEIFEYLYGIGVDYSQGYYFGKPMEHIEQ